MTVQLFWHVSRLHFLCNLQQELFGVHQRPQVKLLVQPWHREMLSETFHGLRASSSRSSSHLHQDRFAFQIATGTNITKADFPVEALRTPLFTTTEFHILLNSLFIVFELGPETVKHFRKHFMVSGPSSTRSSSHLHHDLFACQNRYSPPSVFPLTLTWPVIFCFPTFMLCVFPTMQSRLEIVGLLFVPRAEPNTSPKACGALQTVSTANY